MKKKIVKMRRLLVSVVYQSPYEKRELARYTIQYENFYRNLDKIAQRFL